MILLQSARLGILMSTRALIDQALETKTHNLGESRSEYHRS